MVGAGGKRNGVEKRRKAGKAGQVTSKKKKKGNLERNVKCDFSIKIEKAVRHVYCKKKKTTRNLEKQGCNAILGFLMTSQLSRALLIRFVNVNRNHLMPLRLTVASH